MLESPIIFTDDLVRCIVDGLKTETRRYGGSVGAIELPVSDRLPDDTPFRVSLGQCKKGYGWTDSAGRFHRSPYGRPGCLLWVRESFATVDPEELRGRRRGTTWPTLSTVRSRDRWLSRSGIYLAETNRPTKLALKPRTRRRLKRCLSPGLGGV